MSGTGRIVENSFAKNDTTKEITFTYESNGKNTLYDITITSGGRVTAVPAGWSSSAGPVNPVVNDTFYKHSIVFCDTSFGIENTIVKIEVINTDSTDYSGISGYGEIMMPCTVEFKSNSISTGSSPMNIQQVTITSIEDCYFADQGSGIYYLILECNQGSTYTFMGPDALYDTVESI